MMPAQSNTILRPDGKRMSRSFFRGEHANFHPSDETLAQDDFITDYLTKNLVPAQPFITPKTNIVAFGSCFAANISKYLMAHGYNVTSAKDDVAYISRMGDGIVTTFAIRQQFEWAWSERAPEIELWHTKDATQMGYDESVRLRTRALFDEADVFIITLGLSEIWYDEPTGEVFWRAVPADRHDPSRHKFRVSTVSENLANLCAIYDLIRKHRPDATIVMTLSPIPLTATFRPIPCVAANSVSKAILRAALDEFYRARCEADPALFYFPSYEVVTTAFNHAFTADRRHVYGHVLQFNMRIFERFFCDSGLTDADLLATWRSAKEKDERIGRLGHESVATGVTGEMRREMRKNERMRERLGLRRGERLGNEPSGTTGAG